MDSFSPEFSEQIVQIIAEAAPLDGDDFRTCILKIILENHRRGRIDYFLAQQTGATLANYTAVVADHYRRLAPRYNRLKTSKRCEEWTRLYELLVGIAEKFLVQKGLPPGNETRQAAADCAANAALQLVKVPFPYDIRFKDWAYQFVKYACLKELTRRSHRVSGKTIAMDEDLLEQLCEPHSGPDQTNFLIDLEQAFKQLTENRRLVLLLRYWKGLLFEEIGAVMGKTPNAVMKLHFDAITQLRNLI